MYEHSLEATPAGVTGLAFTVDEESINTDDPSPNPAAVSVTVSIAVTTDQRGSVTVSGDGLLTSSMGGLGVTDDDLESYFRTGIHLLEALLVDTPAYYTTSHDLLDTDDLDDFFAKMTDEHIVIPSQAVHSSPRRHTR
jgi:hypothetical protein